MSKNKHFKHQYSIILEGTTTNDFASDNFRQFLSLVLEAWNLQHRTAKAIWSLKIIK